MSKLVNWPSYQVNFFSDVQLDRFRLVNEFLEQSSSVKAVQPEAFKLIRVLQESSVKEVQPETSKLVSRLSEQ